MVSPAKSNYSPCIKKLLCHCWKERIVQEYWVREQSPKRLIKDKYKKQAAYYHFYTNMRWGFAKNYQISLSSEKLCFKKCISSQFLSQPKYYALAQQLETDYYNICDQLNQQLSESSRSTLHTASGEFIQIRTKDSKPYHPIYSTIYVREISDKNRAFHFKKEFMKYISSLED